MRPARLLPLLALGLPLVGCDGDRDTTVFRAVVNGEAYSVSVAHAIVYGSSENSNLLSIRGGAVRILMTDVHGTGTYALPARSAFFGESGFGAGTVVVEEYVPSRRMRGRFRFASDPAACAGQTPCPVGAEEGAFDLRISAGL